MAEDRIDSVIDQEKVNAEIADLDKGLLKLLDRINEFKDVKISLGDAKSLGDVNTAQRKVTKGQDELSRSLNEYQKIQEQVAQKQAKINALTSDAAVELEKLKQKEAELNKERKDSVKLQEAQEGSIEQLRIQLKQAQQEYDKLSKAERNSAKGTDLLKHVQDIDKELKDLEFSTGRFQRNVGNYQGSAAIIVRALESARQKFQDLNRDAKASPEAVSQAGRELEALQRIVDNPKFLNVSSKFGDASAEVKFFTKALTDLESRGFGSSKEATDLRNRLAELTDQIHDTREEIKALSSDTRGFDLFAGAVSALTSAAQTAAGVSELLGGSNDEVTKSIQRLVAIENIANGVRAISEQLTKKGTAANKAYAFVQAQVAVLTNVASTATQKLNATLKLSLVGLLAIGIFELAKAVGLFGDNSEKTEGQVKLLNDQIERLATATNSAIDKMKFDNDLLIAGLRKRGATEEEINTATIKGLRDQAQEYRNLAQTQLQTISRSTGLQLDNITTLKSAEEALINLKKKQSEIDFIGSQDSKLKKALKSQKELIDGSVQLGEKIVENFRKGTQIDQQATVQQANFLAQQTQKGIELARASVAAREKAEAELAKFRLGVAADTENRLGEIENFSFNARKEHLTAELELRKRIIQVQQNLDLAEITRSEQALAQKGELTGNQEKAFAAQRVLINEKAVQDIIKLEEGLGRRLSEIRIEQAQQRKADVDQAIEEFKSEQAAKAEAATGGLNKDLQDRQQSIERQRLEDRQNALANFKQGLTSKEQFNQRLEDIDKQARSASIQNQIIYYKALIALQESFGLDMTDAKKALLDAQNALNDEDIANTTATAEKKKEILDQTNANYISAVQQIAGAFSGVFGAIFEARKNALQEQIDIIEEMKGKEIEAINASGAAAEEKAARIKVVEAKAQSDREALARRQREIDRQRAIADKAFKVFQIATDTAVAINKIKLLIEAAPDPVTKALYTSQLILAIVSGAASLAAMIATPIPKFRHGTENAPAGPGVWGEAGQEMMIDRKGRLKLSPNKASLVQLMGGEKIIPHERTKAIMNSLGMEHMMGQGAMILNIDQTELVNKTGQMVNELKQLNEKPPMIIHVARDITTSAWYQQHLKN